MADEKKSPDDVHRRLNDIEVRLQIAQTVMATATAIALRAADEDQHRRILHELRRNILITLAQVEPTADQAAVLTREESTDRMLDEIVRLSRA